MSSGLDKYHEDIEDARNDYQWKKKTERFNSIKFNIDKFSNLEYEFIKFNELTENIPMTVNQRDAVNEFIKLLKKTLKFKDKE